MNKRNEILSAIGLNEDEYSMAVFNTAMEYLEEKAKQWAFDISQTKTFWSWWQYQWNIIDDIFYSELKNATEPWSVDIAHYIWSDDHKMDLRKTPIPSTIWDEFYSNMMHEATKEIKAKEAVAI